jgi:hypothetical protein
MELTLGQYKARVAVRDDRANALDRLYIPVVENPQKIEDYPPEPEAKLVDDAPERLVRLLIRGE